MTRAEQKLAKLQSQCDKFNAEIPIGSEVLVRKDDGSKVLTFTTSAAQVLSGHTPVIWLKGISGCYLLDRVSKVIAAFTHEGGKLVERPVVKSPTDTNQEPTK